MEMGTKTRILASGTYLPEMNLPNYHSFPNPQNLNLFNHFELSLNVANVSQNLLSSEMRPIDGRVSASKTWPVLPSNTIMETQPLDLFSAKLSVIPRALGGPDILTKSPSAAFPSTSQKRFPPRDLVPPSLASPESFPFSSHSKSGQDSWPHSIQRHLRDSNPPNYQLVGNGSGSSFKRKLQCPDYGKVFSQLKTFRYPRSRHEGTYPSKYICHICGKSYSDKYYLSSHLKIHRNDKEYQGEMCEKAFNQKVASNMYIKIHTEHKPHKCHICDKVFSRKALLKNHLHSHTGEKPYSCEICAKPFSDHSNMLIHQSQHSGQRPYKCDILWGKWLSKYHHRNCHTGIKPYKCEKCGATFSQQSSMRIHFRRCSEITSESSGSIGKNCSAISNSSSPLKLTPPVPHATSSLTRSLPSTHLRSNIFSSHAVAPQIPSSSQKRAKSFQAFKHEHPRSPKSSASILNSSPAGMPGDSIPLISGLKSSPFIVSSPEKFPTPKTFSPSVAQFSARHQSGKQQIQKPQKYQPQQPQQHSSTLEAWAPTLLLSPGHQDSCYPHSNHSSDNQSDITCMKMIHYKAPNNTTSNTNSEYLRSASEPLRHEQTLHQYYLLQQNRLSAFSPLQSSNSYNPSSYFTSDFVCPTFSNFVI